MKDIWRIVRFTRELWPAYIGISLLTVLLALMNLLQPLFSGWAIDSMHLGSSQVHRVILLAVGIFLLDVLSNLIGNLSGYLGDQVQRRLDYLLSHRYYQHLLELPQQYFDTELTGKIINRLNRSISQITNFFQFVTNNFLQLFFTTIFTLAVVFHYSWQVGVLMLMLYPIYIALTSKSSPKWQAFQSEKNKNLDIANGRFAEVINQVKVVKSFLQEKHELRFFDKHYQETISINKPQSKHWHQNDVYRRSVLNVIFFFTYLFIFIEGARGSISPGVAVALILYGMQIRTPIFTISFLVDNFQRAVSDSRDYFEVMEHAPAITDRPNASSLQLGSCQVVFDKVVFGYDKSAPVLKGVSFTLEPDTRTALVGESGEGKTTITSLLLRLYDIQKGEIRINNQNIHQVTQASLRQSIGVVFQEPALFSGTVHENIAYGRPNASDEEIVAAAQAANADEFIKKFDKGYQTEIGERGLKLSGGQKQRIAIARALLKDAPILILDEATSSLDTKSERQVQQALDRLMKGRTTLIIAHRLSTIQTVDTIITLKGGRVDEIGSPHTLSRSGGIYDQLLRLQAVHDENTTKKLQAYGIEEA